MKVVLVLAAVGALVFWIAAENAERRARLTAKGTAELTQVRLDQGDDNSSDETDLEFRFVADGKPIQTSDSLSGDRERDFRVGQTVTICYDPKNPADADVREGADVSCGA
jgi:hypothetical protein